MPPPDKAEALRDLMTEAIEAFGEPWPGQSWDDRVLDAMREVPRHRFVPHLSLERAYEDSPQPIAHGQTISQPTVVAMMAQALELEEESTVLEIGTGSGYHAAVISVLAGQVFTVERHRPLAEQAGRRLEDAGYPNVQVRAGDGYLGWPEQAPFDRILVTAAPPELPQALVDQLRDGGVLIAPIGPEHEVQQLVRFRKDGEVLIRENLGPVRFVPMLPGDEG
ncbi:MAG: protein-L-isoaspartate(D-aspartate) O-methyltransferase [Deltaproteobacteria bacterium]|nr:MAG: protein-L-isoaspartate(D-aspartate) O-methyltransferase [Deltaproteobacteria bacterium]